MTGSRGMLAAKQPLVVPMLLRLSNFKLNSYVVLVVSKQKGITLVFKTDPLQNVDINSTFDSIAVIQNFIQREIEGQLRQMFREDLPGIIHRLSQQWVKSKVEAPYLTKRPAPSPWHGLETRQYHPPPPSLGSEPSVARRQYAASMTQGMPRAGSAMSVASTSGGTHRSVKTAPPTQPPHDPSSPLHEAESFDPTYGLRPDGLPAKSVFRGFGQLFVPIRGLAELAEEPHGTDERDDETSFDVVDWEDTIPDWSPPPSIYEGEEEQRPEYETIPAVGGGTITRPRVYHQQSQIQPRPDIGLRPTAHRMTQSLELPAQPPVTDAGMSRLRSHQSIASDHGSMHAYGFSRPVDLAASLADFRTGDKQSRRPLTPDSLETQASSSHSGINTSAPTHLSLDAIPGEEYGSSPIYIKRPPSRQSVADSNVETSSHMGSPPNTLRRRPEADPTIILRPSLNNTIHHLSTLSQSNHTLSPYTRSLEHFTVRSVPPRTAVAMATERQPVKAVRKRTHRLGGAQRSKANTESPSEPAPTPPSPIPPSEFDAGDMDRYFRDSEAPPNSPENGPMHMRQHYAY
jgi:mitochondrial distribution and morphology protein 34